MLLNVTDIAYGKVILANEMGKGAILSSTEDNLLFLGAGNE